jgi:hypothetical protein
LFSLIITLSTTVFAGLPVGESGPGQVCCEISDTGDCVGGSTCSFVTTPSACTVGYPNPCTNYNIACVIAENECFHTTTAGLCDYGCDFGKSCCSTGCSNLLTDSNHCGDCTTVCSTTEYCSNGACVEGGGGGGITCEIEQVVIDTSGCGTDNHCSPGDQLTISIGYPGAECGDLGFGAILINGSRQNCDVGYSIGPDDIEGFYFQALNVMPNVNGDLYDTYSFVYTIPDVGADCNGNFISSWDVSVGYYLPTEFDDMHTTHTQTIYFDDGLCGNGFCEPGEETSCPNDCSISASCGNGICEGPGETPNTCLADCGNLGWTLMSDGWAIEEGSLRGNKSNIYAYSNYFNIQTGKQYVLTADILNPNSECTATIDLDNGACLNAQTWEMNLSCFVADNIIISLTDSNAWQTSLSASKLINPNSNADSDGYINKARIKIAITCSTVPDGDDIMPAYFDNIEFKEVKPAEIVYDDPVFDVGTTSACCPANYCWDGLECVDSAQWMTNSQEEPIYNNIFDNNDPNPWRYNHVNTSAQPESIGYRCVSNGYGIAEWQPAEIKYDWDYKESGYCNKPENCFGRIAGPNFVDTGDSCISNGTYVDDSYTVNQGNHLCLEGEWTTRTFVAASYLTVWAGTNPYILMCGEPSEIFNNDSLNTLLESSCVIIIRESASIEKVYLALVPADSTHTEVIYGILREQHFDPGGLGPENAIPSNIQLGECEITASPEWFDCIVGSNAPKFDIYHNRDYNIWVISDNTITELSPTTIQQIWNNIVNFFRRLFGLSQEERQYELFNATSNYNNIYILKNTSININGLEEQKYDEIKYEVLNYLYLNHSPATLDYPLDEGYIRQNYGEYPNEVFYTNAYGVNELIIISQDRTDLWPYLTATLRDRR